MRDIARLPKAIIPGFAKVSGIEARRSRDSGRRPAIESRSKGDEEDQELQSPPQAGRSGTAFWRDGAGARGGAVKEEKNASLSNASKQSRQVELDWNISDLSSKNDEDVGLKRPRQAVTGSRGSSLPNLIHLQPTPRATTHKHTELFSTSPQRVAPSTSRIRPRGRPSRLAPSALRVPSLTPRPSTAFADLPATAFSAMSAKATATLPAGRHHTQT